MLPDQRRLFDVPSNVAYLNSAYMGPRLKSVTAAGEAALAFTATPWNVGPPDFIEPVEKLRSTVGALLGDTGEGVAIVPQGGNTSLCGAATCSVPPSWRILRIRFAATRPVGLVWLL